MIKIKLPEGQLIKLLALRMKCSLVESNELSLEEERAAGACHIFNKTYNIYKDQPVKVKIDYQRDSLLSEQGMTLMATLYASLGKFFKKRMLAAEAYCYGDYQLAQRIYDYTLNWFMFASPVLSNAPSDTGSLKVCLLVVSYLTLATILIPLYPILKKLLGFL